MKHWKRMLIRAMVLSMMSPAALWAEGELEVAELDETAEVRSSFQNPTQAERAERIADASFSEEDAKAVAQIEAETKVEQVSRDDADSIFDERLMAYADGVVEEKALAYATEQAEASGFEPGSDDYNQVKRQAYNDAMARGTAVGDWDNAWETAYKAGLELARESDAWEEARAYAEERAYGGPDGFSPNAYETFFDEAYANYVAEYPGITYEEIHKMRFVEHMGWGEITKYYGLHSSINGRGRYMKMKGTLPVDEVAPPEPELLSLDDEIAQATLRNTRTGWNEEPGYKAKNKNGSNKKYGLAQTSGVASSDVSGNNAAKMNKGKSKSQNQSSYSTQTSTSTSSQVAQGGSPGLGSSKAKNSNRGGSSNSNKGGKSADKDSKGNNGKNGNNAGGKKK